MRIVCISDTHEQEDKITLPEGDILIHAGDITYNGKYAAIAKFSNWLKNQPFKYKLVIAGNHDVCFELKTKDAYTGLLHAVGATYLQDSGIEIDGKLYWGSPWQPTFYNWSFNVDRGPKIAKKWALIPDQTSVLITHGPPFGINDLTLAKEHAGCEELRKRVLNLPELKLHVHGHIHNGYGSTGAIGIKFVNASTCNERYRPENPPIVVEI